MIVVLWVEVGVMPLVVEVVVMAVEPLVVVEVGPVMLMVAVVEVLVVIVEVVRVVGIVGVAGGGGWSTDGNCGGGGVGGGGGGCGGGTTDPCMVYCKLATCSCGGQRRSGRSKRTRGALISASLDWKPDALQSLVGYHPPSTPSNKVRFMPCRLGVVWGQH